MSVSSFCASHPPRTGLVRAGPRSLGLAHVRRRSGFNFIVCNLGVPYVSQRHNPHKP